MSQCQTYTKALLFGQAHTQISTYLLQSEAHPSIVNSIPAMQGDSNKRYMYMYQGSSSNRQQTQYLCNPPHPQAMPPATSFSTKRMLVFYLHVPQVDPAIKKSTHQISQSVLNDDLIDTLMGSGEYSLCYVRVYQGKKVPVKLPFKLGLDL